MKIQKITTSKKNFLMKNTVESLLNDFWAVQQKVNNTTDNVELHFDDIVNEALEMFMKNDKEYKKHQKDVKEAKKNNSSTSSEDT